jgi:hypothetical protein
MMVYDARHPLVNTVYSLHKSVYIFLGMRKSIVEIKKKKKT